MLQEDVCHDGEYGLPHRQISPAGALVITGPSPRASPVHLSRCVDQSCARGGGEAGQRSPQLLQLRQLRPDLDKLTY